MRKFVAIALVLAAAAVPALGLAAPPVIHEHVNETSDPFPATFCGVHVTAVETMVGQFLQDASGASLETSNLTTVYTAANGNAIEFHRAGVIRESAPTDNGDGTLSFVDSVRGISPLIKIVGGPVIGAPPNVGQITFEVTVDAATGDFVSFEVVDIKGPPRLNDCDAIVAALS